MKGRDEGGGRGSGRERKRQGGVGKNKTVSLFLSNSLSLSKEEEETKVSLSSSFQLLRSLRRRARRLFFLKVESEAKGMSERGRQGAEKKTFFPTPSLSQRRRRTQRSLSLFLSPSFQLPRCLTKEEDAKASLSLSLPYLLCVPNEPERECKRESQRLFLFIPPTQTIPPPRRTRRSLPRQTPPPGSRRPWGNFAA